jgi:hypothetical protein
MAADLDWIVVGPGPFDKGAAGMGVPGLGDAARPRPLSGGVCPGCQAKVTHELSGGLKACEVPRFRHACHCDGALEAPQAERLCGDTWRS